MIGCRRDILSGDGDALTVCVKLTGVVSGFELCLLIKALLRRCGGVALVSWSAALGEVDEEDSDAGLRLPPGRRSLNDICHMLVHMLHMLVNRNLPRASM